MQPIDPFVTILRDWIDIFMRRSMKNFILFTKENGLSMSQIGALFRIHKGSGGVSDIGDELGVTSAAASQMLERLVQQDLILRTEDPHDRRVKQIVLTDKGRQTILEVLHARQDWLVNLAATLSPAEKEQVGTALNILVEKANQLDEPSKIEL